MSNRSKQNASKGPDKGAFPLDHFHECDNEAKQYNQCIQKHENMPKRCRKYQVDYLQCRMNNGLMEKEDLSKLGLGPETSWESEEQEKQFLFDKINRIKTKAMDEVQKKTEQSNKQE
ncbi:unnamed protein product [Paramecium pentaurelia]|uniref:CHCH domain-containing protein n=1 Tax=Paramecium pentaurelia TaxID=43138 RepID=A0A8S1SSB2_9CILI|nr:unnamed protein product [Paramecium pentaurelia]